MSLQTHPTLSGDEVDDVLYLIRTNDSESELTGYLSQLSTQHSCSAAHILESCIEEESGNTVFHFCAANGFTDLLKKLIQTFAESNITVLPSLNRKNTAGNTPIHWAALNGHASSVQLLADSGADVWVKNAAGNLPVFEAERAEKDECVAVLLLAGGKEVEDQLKSKEGSAEGEDMTEGDDNGEGSSKGADGADGAMEGVEKTTLDS